MADELGTPNQPTDSVAAGQNNPGQTGQPGGGVPPRFGVMADRLG